MPKFPFTNYHELNLDWILKKVNALFDASEENARTIRTYDTRLTRAEQTAANAETAATSAQQLADAAAANADNALSVAGTADAKADSALTAATDASSAVSGALTTAQEARQIAGAAVATANDAAATASGLESLANTANQNATAAVETAGTANQNATAAQTAANTADQKAVAAQQTANSAQSAAATNAGNITTLQTNVTDLNRQLSDSTTGLDSKAPVIVNTASGDIASFSDGADGMPVKSLVANIEPLQSGTGDPSPDNVRPISGHTGANVTRTGKNLFEVAQDNKWLNGSGVIIDDTDSAVSQKILITEGVTITLSTAAVGNALAMCFYNSSGTLLQRIAQANTKTLTATSPSGTTYMYAGRYKKAGGEAVQLEFGATATDYEVFTGYNDYTIDLGGTVYGGTLDVTSGVLTVTDANIASYNGETLTGEWISDRDVYAAGTTPTTGAQVVYKLATPQTYQLEAQSIDTVYGTNNIWSDTGDTEVTYPADTKLYIDGKIAELQALVLEN